MTPAAFFDAFPGTDSRLAAVRLAAGGYTIEATTWGSGATDGYDLMVAAVLDSSVCAEPEWVTSTSESCAWLSVDDERFADTMNVRRP